MNEQESVLLLAIYPEFCSENTVEKIGGGGGGSDPDSSFQAGTELLNFSLS